MIINEHASETSELSLPDINENDIRLHMPNILEILLTDRIVSTSKSA